MGTYLYRTENVTVSSAAAGTTFTHGLGVAPAGAAGEVFIRHRTATFSATVLSSSTQIIVLAAMSGSGYPVNVDVCVMAFHSLIS